MNLIRKLWFPSLAGAIVLLGVLAMVNGIQSRSLLLDEALFARNVDKYPAGFFIPSAPAAPLFYHLTHALVSLFGRSEWVYRLVPVLGAVSGFLLLSLILFRSFSRAVSLVSISLAATSAPLVHYAANAHPFATDFFFSAILLFIAIRLSREFRWTEWWLWIGISALAVTMSFTAVFVVAACGAVLLFRNGCRGKALRVQLSGLSVLGIFTAFILVRFVFPLAQNRGDLDYWTAYFPSQILPWTVAKFLFTATENVLEYLFWSGSGGLAGLFLALLGSAWLIHEKKIGMTLFCWGPVALVALASLMQKWPYGAVRTVLFLLPFFLILTAGGMELVWRATARSLPSRILIVTAFLALLVPHSWVLKKAVIPARDSEEAVKSLSLAMVPEIRDGDRFMVYYAAEAQFRFYFHRYLDRAAIQPWSDRGNREVLQAFVTENAKSGGRFWLVFSHFDESEEQIMISAAEKVGKRVSSHVFPGCEAVLFEGENPSPAH